MKTAAVALVLWAVPAAAQGSGSEAVLVLLVGPPALISVALDVALLSTLLTDGTAGRGRSISTMVFGVVAAGISAVCLGLGVSSRTSIPAWTVVSAAALGIGLGTLSVGVYGVAHPPDTPPEPEAPRPKKELSPQL